MSEHNASEQRSAQDESTQGWPEHLPVTQVRIARPTDRLDALVAFYTALGLTTLGEFHDHGGYDGVFLGLPGTGHHLEFIHHRDGSPGAAPSAEHLLVLYLGSTEAVAATTERLAALGHAAVDAENPYWRNAGAVTIPDPDGWRVVLVPNAGITA